MNAMRRMNVATATMDLSVELVILTLSVAKGKDLKIRNHSHLEILRRLRGSG